MRIALLGTSAEALALCRHLGLDVVVVADPIVGERKHWRGIPCTSSDVSAVGEHGVTGAIIAIDDPAARRRCQERCERSGLHVVDAVAGRLGDDVSHGAGLFATFNTNLSEGGVVGRGTRLNIGANVMHDATLGDFVTVAPGATLLGHVTVRDEAYIGAGSTILPGVTIGARAMVGAGAVVTRDVADDAVVKGVPAR